MCYELDDLKEDEIAVVLEAMKQRFDTVEQGAFSFSIKEEEDYSPLKQALRQRNGDWMDSGFSDEKLKLQRVSGIEFSNAENEYSTHADCDPE